MLVVHAIITVSHVQCTCNNILVSHDTLQVAWVQFVKGLISGCKESEVSRLAQLVEHARVHYHILDNKKRICPMCNKSSY